MVKRLGAKTTEDRSNIERCVGRISGHVPSSFRCLDIGLREQLQNGAGTSDMDEVSGVQQEAARLVETCTGWRAENYMQQLIIISMTHVRCPDI